MKNQLPALTALRGVAALFILIHHIVVYFIPEIGNYFVEITPFFTKSYLWVDFFFILSGFIIAHVYRQEFCNWHWAKSYKPFIVSRFARIYPLHFLMLICFLFVELLQLYIHTGESFIGKQSVSSLAANITLLQAFLKDSTWNEPAWAISAEWLSYLLIPPIIFYLEQTGRRVDIIILILIMAILFLMNLKMGTLNFVSWKSIVRCGSEMIIGILSYKHKFKIKQNPYLNYSSVSSILMVLVLVTLWWPVSHFITICIFPLLIIVLSNLSKHYIFTNPFLLFIGKISYSIYMIHWFFMSFLGNVLNYFSGNLRHLNFSLPHLVYIAIVCIFFIILLATITFNYIEQPLRYFIKKLIFNNSHLPEK